MITIITKDYCPYCTSAKQLLTSLGLEYEEIDVTHNQDKLIEISNISKMRTVPQIFAGNISGQNILGGYDDILKLNKEGKLINILNN